VFADQLARPQKCMDKGSLTLRNFTVRPLMGR
jgi:hypothetical protein